MLQRVFKILTDREMRNPSNIILPSKEATTDNVPEYVLRLKEEIRKPFNMARRHLQTSYSRQKKYYDKHSRPSTYQEGDLVQIYKPIPPPGGRTTMLAHSTCPHIHRHSEKGYKASMEE